MIYPSEYVINNDHCKGSPLPDMVHAGEMLRVAVIGAGAGGLATLRHLTANPNISYAVAYEQTGSVGGTWVYTDNLEVDEYGQPIHSSMYKNLRTNLPKETMAYPDFPFKTSLPSFMMHYDVQKYLEEYADHFELRPHIKMNQRVESVEPILSENKTTWEVTSSCHLKESKTNAEMFDAVIVANGHYAQPLNAELPGLDQFKGIVTHSHMYRHPEMYTGKTVICLGAGSSGLDIILDLAPFAKMVYLCHRRPRVTSPLPENVKQAAGIKEMREHSVVLEDGTELDIDVLLMCTGYKYNFPFLAGKCQVQIEEERVMSLYKHCIHTKYPTLSFIGVPKVVCPFPLMDCQVKFILNGLLGIITHPCQEEMDADIENDYRKRLSEGMPHRYAHHMGPRQWAYNDELAKLGKFAPIPRVVQRLYDYVHGTRVKNLPSYKRINYALVDDVTFCEQK